MSKKCNFHLNSIQGIKSKIFSLTLQLCLPLKWTSDLNRKVKSDYTIVKVTILCHRFLLPPHLAYYFDNHKYLCAETTFIHDEKNVYIKVNFILSSVFDIFNDSTFEEITTMYLKILALFQMAGIQYHWIIID